MRELFWLGSTKKVIRGFPEEVKDEIGYSLFVAQIGEKADNTKKYHGLPGVLEIRSDYYKDTYRAVYAYKIDEDLYVLHVYQKKSHEGSKLPNEVKETINSRYKDAVKHSKERKK